MPSGLTSMSSSDRGCISTWNCSSDTGLVDTPWKLSTQSTAGGTTSLKSAAAGSLILCTTLPSSYRGGSDAGGEFVLPLPAARLLPALDAAEVNLTDGVLDGALVVATGFTCLSGPRATTYGAFLETVGGFEGGGPSAAGDGDDAAASVEEWRAHGAATLRQSARRRVATTTPRREANMARKRKRGGL